jgi:STE24 endopeptidase
MTPNTILYIIIAILVFEFALTKFIDYLNTLNWSSKLPEEAKGIYDEEKYKKQQDYEKTNHKFNNISSSFSFIIMLIFLSF